MRDSSVEIVGSPDWVMEIVSPRSIKKDKVLLREAYFKAGVGEYWLVDALGEEVDFQILVPGDKEYQAVDGQDGWLASPTFGKSFRLERSKDDDGLLQYTLHMKN
jgi:Uma2 family endonuclease